MLVQPAQPEGADHWEYFAEGLFTIAILYAIAGMAVIIIQPSLNPYQLFVLAGITAFLSWVCERVYRKKVKP